MKGTLFIIFNILMFFSCGTRKELDARNEMEDLGITPRLRLDRDTIVLGDSLTGVIGGIFKTWLTKEEKQQLIGSLCYRIDTVEIELKSDTKFYTTSRVNDSTFRFAFLPKHQNAVAMENKSIYAAIRVEYLKDNQIREHIFSNRFDYYINK